MPAFHVSKSILVNAPVDKVYDTIKDFNHWTPWSPWLIQEPEAKVNVNEDGQFYEWEGNRVGSGNMRMSNTTTNESVDLDLTFLKPWKSTAKVYFKLSGDNGTTNLEWGMDSSLPFFMFWMKKMMVAWIGMDYERGLVMLKSYIEDGDVHSKLEFKGKNEFPGCQYVGITTHCTMDDVGTRMAADFEKLGEFIQANAHLAAGVPFSIYHKFDMVSRQVSYTSGFPVTEIPANLDGMVSGSIPSVSVYTVSHTGPYRQMANAWSTLYAMKQNKEFKQDKKVDPFETYLNDPADTPPNDLVTEVHFPIK